MDNKSAIEILLDSLDKSANSDSAWLHFDVNSHDEFDIKNFILKQLKTEYFHFALLENDINRGWEHYIKITFPENRNDTVVILQKPGNSWNGNENLAIEIITQEQAKEFIVDLLTGEQKHFSKSSLGTQLDKESASITFENFITCIKGINNIQATFYNVRPDFLFTVEDYYSSDFTKLGYFENAGRDFVLAILLSDKETELIKLKILMTNGYS